MTSITFLNLQNGKIFTFLVQNWQIISAYTRSFPSLKSPTSYPKERPSFPSSEKESNFSNSCLSVILSVYLDLWSIYNSTTNGRTLWTWYRYLNVYGSLRMKFYKMSWVTWPKWPPHPYMVKILRNLLLQHRLNDGLSTATRVLPRLFKWWPWVDLCLFLQQVQW